MSKILISGYYGFGNIGDEAILKTMIDALNQLEHPLSLTVLSNTPEETISHFKINAVNRSKIGPVVKAIRNCDVLISGGGSLLQESTGKLSIFYYLFIYFVAMAYKKKIIVFSQGIGPVYRNISKRLIAYVFNKVHSISVRDRQSKEELVAYGVKADKIIVTADPVMAFEQQTLKPEHFILSNYNHYDPNLKTIGFALKNNKSQDASKAFVEIIRKLKETPCNIVLVPFHFKEDQALIEEIVSELQEEVIAVKNRLSVDEMLNVIQSMDVLVGVRLHALIFAAVVNTPMVGISYDPKIDAFLESMEEHAICNIDSMDCLTLIKAIQERLVDNDKHKEKLYNRVGLYKSLLKDFNQQIDSVLE
ncbi:MAG: polysaccharide pyruvyl transferase CsaB [Clostridia bacterium]|nr:polysaccharide pyruvyl transferase CsaB [Clostridia bacterium]